jgi:hypothetical protein
LWEALGVGGGRHSRVGSTHPRALQPLGPKHAAVPLLPRRTCPQSACCARAARRRGGDRPRVSHRAPSSAPARSPPRQHQPPSWPARPLPGCPPCDVWEGSKLQSRRLAAKQCMQQRCCPKPRRRRHPSDPAPQSVRSPSTQADRGPAWNKRPAFSCTPAAPAGRTGTRGALPPCRTSLAAAAPPGARVGASAPGTCTLW